MTVSEMISALQSLDKEFRDTPVEAFGPTSAGNFALRPVTYVWPARRKTVAMGDAGPVVLVQTAIYDR